MRCPLLERSGESAIGYKFRFARFVTLCVLRTLSIRESIMDIAGTLERAKAESWSDAEIVERVKSGETALYEILMRLQPAIVPRGLGHSAQRRGSRRCHAGLT